MDTSAIIVVILMAGSFFGFVLWAALHSRKNNAKELPEGSADIDFSKGKKRINNT